MQIDWTAVLVALLGSNLVLEIWKTIKESIRKKRRLDVESELNNIKDAIKVINERLSNDYKRLDNIENILNTIVEVISRNSKGTVLSLQNDSIIFDALRKNHINGESEAQERKLAEYYKECAEFNLKMH